MPLALDKALYECTYCSNRISERHYREAKFYFMDWPIRHIRQCTRLQTESRELKVTERRRLKWTGHVTFVIKIDVCKIIPMEKYEKVTSEIEAKIGKCVCVWGGGGGTGKRVKL
jgi:hypothetical protein